MKRSAVVLIAVLVVVVILSLAAYQFSELMTAEYRAGDSAIRAAQAKTLAISGVHYTAALLADPNSMTGRLNNNPYDNESTFRAIAVNDDDRPRFKGMFSMIAPPSVDEALAGSTTVRFGVSDESGKINLNALVSLDSSGQIAHDVLMKLPNMTEEIADAIIDWIDANDEPRPNGAENTYYSALTPNYRCKNGPLDSLEELLLIRGVTPDLLFGTDKNHNGRPDADDAEGSFDPGWAALLTVYSREINFGADNTARIYLNDKDLNGLYDKLNTALGADLANWILAYRQYGAATPQQIGAGKVAAGLSKSQLNLGGRGSNNVAGIFYMVDAVVAIPQPGGGGGKGPTPTTYQLYPSPLTDPTQREQLLPVLLDKCTTRNAAEIPSRVNINTAPKAVLAALPQLEAADVESILDARPTVGSADATDPAFQSTAWLLTKAKLPTSKLRSLERYITARSQTYRVQSIGYFGQGGPVARVEAVIDTNAGQPRVIYFRDLTELGRGYEVPR